MTITCAAGEVVTRSTARRRTHRRRRGDDATAVQRIDEQDQERRRQMRRLQNILLLRSGVVVVASSRRRKPRRPLRTGDPGDRDRDAEESNQGGDRDTTVHSTDALSISFEFQLAFKAFPLFYISFSFSFS